MSPATLTSLEPLIEQFGIQRGYRAADGTTVVANPDAVMAVLRTLGVDTDGNVQRAVREEQERTRARLIEPVVLAWNGHFNGFSINTPGHLEFQIHTEQGDVIEGRSRAARLHAPVRQMLPAGYHELHVRTARGEGSALIISAPRQCYSGDRPREWGVFAPLYALRNNRRTPIGDFGDLRSLMRWTGEMGGDFAAILPISAAFLREPFDPSPYSPASRLFWNELYLDLDTLSEQAGCSSAERLLRRGAKLQRLDALADEKHVDYRRVADAKRAVLERLATCFFEKGGEQSADFLEFHALYPDAADYAQFRAAGERFRKGWMGWPAGPRDARLRAADLDADVVRYHTYAQFAAHTQLASAAHEARAHGVRLYLDLPLGVHPDSYDVWRNRDLFLLGAAAGAPPDPFFTKGQDWGFPPLNPIRLREQHYAHWRRVLQTQLRYAGVLRLDHVMGLHRLYIVPAGFEPTRGVYVRYPADELYAVLTLESARHQASIVGEDLGTVPAEVRKAMVRHAVKRMFVVQFEATGDVEPPLGAVPRTAVASLNTHDMPPFGAFWEGFDADLRREIGLLDDAGVRAVRVARARTVRALSRSLRRGRALDATAARTALLEFLAASPADMVLINIEDLWLEREPQNVPGTTAERPNWRRRLKYTLEDLRADRDIRDLLKRIEEIRVNASASR